MRKDNEALKGKKVKDYNGHKAKIVKVVRFEKWKKLQKYDASGWLQKKCWKEFNLRKSDLIVAVKFKEGNTEVYTLGNGGVELIDKTNKKNKDGSKE